ncbi:hypothetical protein DERP_001181 [Dermatophagoides pteronyssinus]|uniref:Uncharacterized protein n=1 Tax=Dermatophagoides pteronyssinus TaxID=6956 RepID=A0ABQ8JE89_DERPT|nr:hypothetical protein DERP_001181 [Dermatophagoides pteronyssinus]
MNCDLVSWTLINIERVLLLKLYQIKSQNFDIDIKINVFPILLSFNDDNQVSPIDKFSINTEKTSLKI